MIRISNGYISTIHGTFQTVATAERMAARWNRVFKRRNQPIVATVQPILGSEACHRDQMVEALIDDLKWRAEQDHQR